ncbi:hypothetical protein V1264_020279 [Littorina saxatilis]|uniref:Uncharacterized protein n=1 Tax=Littorina saxatilis TaxID=31220 RepID=A0AAN9BAZ6_9CAEN
MAKRIAYFLILVLASVATTEALRLRCRRGLDYCNQWKTTPVFYGDFQGDKVCCPAVQGQAVQATGFAYPDDCHCTIGTAEQYPGFGSGSSAVAAKGLAIVLTVLVTGFLI